MSAISKLLERLVSKQLLRYLKDNDLLLDLQSAYREHHSTETAVLKVLSDILSALDTGNIAMMLTLLDLSAAFDSVDRNTLMQRLRKSYGLGGKVIDWFTSYLSKAASSHDDIQFGAIGTSIWSATRLGPRTDLVSPLHC